MIEGDKIFYRHYILFMPALFHAESTELLAKTRILAYYQFMLLFLLSI